MDLHVVGVRYWSDRPAPDESNPVDAYRAGGAYADALAGGTLTAREPAVPEDQLGADPIANLGRINGAIADAVAEGLRAGRRTVVVGGNCSHFPGVVGGMQDVYGPTARIGLVWFDAHGDFNTPRTTPSGMLGGMPVAVAAGRLAAACDHLYLHIDSDVLDAALTPNHPTKEPGGPGVEATLAAIETVMRTGKVTAYGLVSVNAAGDGADVSLAAALALLRGGLGAWSKV